MRKVFFVLLLSWCDWRDHSAVERGSLECVSCDGRGRYISDEGLGGRR